MFFFSEKLESSNMKEILSFLLDFEYESPRNSSKKLKNCLHPLKETVIFYSQKFKNEKGNKWVYRLWKLKNF